MIPASVPGPAAMVGEQVIARDLTVTHHTSAGVVRALDPISLAVDPGASLAVMGPSGCGKSTLLGLLAALARPTSGSVIIGGDIVSDLDDRARTRFRRTRLGMVYQADNLLPHLTIEENVGLQVAISRPRREVPPDRPAAAILERLGIGELAQRLPDELSGGQRQRAAVGRALVHRPAVVLADEPTAALDDRNAEAVIKLLLDVQRATGTTLVMATHDPAMAAHLDRTLYLAAPTEGWGCAGALRPR